MVTIQVTQMKRCQQELTGQPSQDNLISHRKIITQSASPITALVAPPLLFPHLKFQRKKTYFRGKRQGSRLSESWRDTFGTTTRLAPIK
jgi:hypothetical protein